MIVITADDRNDVTQLRLEMGSLDCALKVYDGLTNDPSGNKYNWLLMVNGEIHTWRNFEYQSGDTSDCVYGVCGGLV